MEIPEGEERNTEYLKKKMIENFLQNNVRHQTTDLGSSENTSKIYAKENL